MSSASPHPKPNPLDEPIYWEQYDWRPFWPEGLSTRRHPPRRAYEVSRLLWSLSGVRLDIYKFFQKRASRNPNGPGRGLNPEAIVNISYAQLGVRLGRTPQTIKRHIDYLVKLGFLVRSGMCLAKSSKPEQRASYCYRVPLWQTVLENLRTAKNDEGNPKYGMDPGTASGNRSLWTLDGRVISPDEYAYFNIDSVFNAYCARRAPRKHGKNKPKPEPTQRAAPPNPEDACDPMRIADVREVFNGHKSPLPIPSEPARTDVRKWDPQMHERAVQEIFNFYKLLDQTPATDEGTRDFALSEIRKCTCTNPQAVAQAEKRFEHWLKRQRPPPGPQ